MDECALRSTAHCPLLRISATVTIEEMAASQACHSIHAATVDKQTSHREDQAAAAFWLKIKPCLPFSSSLPKEIIKAMQREQGLQLHNKTEPRRQAEAHPVRAQRVAPLHALARSAACEQRFSVISFMGAARCLCM